MNAPHNPFAPRAPVVRVGEAPEDTAGMSGATKAILIAVGVTGAFWILSRMWESKSDEERLAGQIDELSALDGAGGGANPNPGVVIVMPVAR